MGALASRQKVPSDERINAIVSTRRERRAGGAHCALSDARLSVRESQRVNIMAPVAKLIVSGKQ